MAKVRIYELAKEAGMGSKALADILIAKGYDIKGHSSTVDEDIARQIRRKVLKSMVGPVDTQEETEEQAPRRRTTIIRRRPRQDDVEMPAEADDEPLADAAQSETLTPPQAQESAAPTVADDADIGTGEEPEDAAVVEGEPDSPAPEPPAAEVDESAEQPAPPAEVAAEAAEIEAPVAETEETEKEVITKPKIHTRAPAARVVGTIELPAEQTETSPARQRSKKSTKAEPKGVGKTEKPAVAAEPPAGGGGRGRKKGKRGGGDGDNDERAGKGARRGKKGVKFTHFEPDYQPRSTRRVKRGKGAAVKKNVPSTVEMKASKRKITIFETMSVGDLAANMKIKSNEVIAKLMGLGVMATVNQAVDVDTATLIAADFGYEIEQGITEEIGVQMLEEREEGGKTEPRSPVVTVMGHVDHGKTSILDAIRKTDVAAGEAGGITQHIGAYHVRSKAGDVTFVDTPGHAAFTEMRSRGAQVTDLVILVVAADDGVMDQTREAINHAQAAGVPILVAVNKIDKDNADPDRVKRELAELELIPEEWGGQTIYCETSAKQNVGIDDLMENIQLMSEILELGADRTRKAKGRVLEAKLDKGRGPVATILVQDGTLKSGENFIAGQHSGKVRAMRDDRNRPVKEAGPSMPVEVQGLSGVPQAGDEFIVVTDEKMAKNVSQARTMKARETELAAGSKISLDNLFEALSEGDVIELRIVIRADVQGTLEAFAKAAADLSTDEVKVRVLHEGTGAITDSDILLASASDAIVIGFNVRPTGKIKDLAEKESVDLRSYDVIYHAMDDIRNAMLGMLAPTFAEEVIGSAEIRDVFSVPKVGKIAGCAVTEGVIRRNAGVRVVRDGVVAYTGKISSLKRFKDDVREVSSGYECGIGVENFNDIKVGDRLEAFVMQEVEATLE
jgi:translation initiation factor IF-2